MTVLLKSMPAGCGCDAPEHAKTLVSIDEALRRISQAVCPVKETERLALGDAIGRILAEPVQSRGAMPPFDNAAMDGYAIDAGALSGNGPWVLSVCARLAAGQPVETPLANGGAARIFTGAQIPEGADTVVMQEHVRRLTDTIHLERRPDAGANIRRAGSEMDAGETVLDAGRSLGSREIAACAAAGAGDVSVRRRVRVALLVTGDEVRQAGSARAAAQIWDTNTPMLRGELAGQDVDLVVVETSLDSRAGLKGRLAEVACEADLVITTGGLSVGEEDHVRSALGDLDADIRFAGVAIKPGKPVAFGRLGSALWLGLPGNPLAAFVTWQLFGTAVLRRLNGQPISGLPRRNVVTAHGIRRKAGRCEVRPVSIVGFDALGREVVTFQNATHSERVGRLPDTHGLMFLPAETDILPEGALVEFQQFPGL
ncbi:gephyrin-like molybdotransferase Glp [Stappia sp. ES.058]|uniref:molybdopterin molybdotransferase MoeA n=1 Tax=Stappia sp. ES.058 TaxID=1881061 RepID=UPI00087C1EF5|nr:gephyrin-like molybdotransferase Glp [Stappia sp. ES.058]SDU04506.1 molybdopterin molybdochelatase [Stappia sp. ES.058]